MLECLLGPPYAFVNTMRGDSASVTPIQKITPLSVVVLVVIVRKEPKQIGFEISKLAVRNLRGASVGDRFWDRLTCHNSRLVLERIAERLGHRLRRTPGRPIVAAPTIDIRVSDASQDSISVRERTQQRRSAGSVPWCFLDSHAAAVQAGPRKPVAA